MPFLHLWKGCCVYFGIWKCLKVNTMPCWGTAVILQRLFLACKTCTNICVVTMDWVQLIFLLGHKVDFMSLKSFLARLLICVWLSLSPITLFLSNLIWLSVSWEFHVITFLFQEWICNWIIIVWIFFLIRIYQFMFYYLEIMKIDKIFGWAFFSASPCSSPPLYWKLWRTQELHSGNLFMLKVCLLFKDSGLILVVQSLFFSCYVLQSFHGYNTNFLVWSQIVYVALKQRLLHDRKVNEKYNMIQNGTCRSLLPFFGDIF